MNTTERLLDAKTRGVPLDLCVIGTSSAAHLLRYPVSPPGDLDLITYGEGWEIVKRIQTSTLRKVPDGNFAGNTIEVVYLNSQTKETEIFPGDVPPFGIELPEMEEIIATSLPVSVKGVGEVKVMHPEIILKMYDGMRRKKDQARRRILETPRRLAAA